MENNERTMVDVPMEITTNSEEFPVVENKVVNDATKYLGICSCPNNNTQKEFERREQQAKEYCERLKRANLTVNKEWTNYWNYWCPDLRYCMIHEKFTRKQWEQLQMIVTGIILNKLKMNRNMSRAVIHGLTDLGGLNIPKFETIASQENIQCVLTNLRLDNGWTNLLRIAIDELWLEAGIERSALKGTVPFYLYKKHG